MEMIMKSIKLAFILIFLLTKTISAQDVHMLSFKSGIGFGSMQPGNGVYTSGVSMDVGMSIEYGMIRPKDHFRLGIGIVNDVFSTSLRHPNPLITNDSYVVAGMNSRFESSVFLITVLAGYSNRYMSQKSRLLPTLDAGLELYIVPDERSGISGQRISITRISGQPESRKVQVDYVDYYDRRITPFLLLGGTYDIRGNHRISIPISFGYRIPIFRRYQFSDGLVSLDDGPVFFERIEKSGAGRYLQAGLTFRF
jgi:hypothetical protein